MFTWICPKCGREVPPSYNECPDCAREAPVAQQPPAEPPLALPPTKPRVNTEAKHRMPGWLLAVIFAAGFIVVGAVVFFASRYFLGTRDNKVAAEIESAPMGLDAPPKPSGYSKYIEVTGFRLTEDKTQKLEVQFLVVNHSAAEIASLSGEVTLKPKTGKADAKPLAKFSFKIPSLRPYQSQELKASAQTGLRAYELPDWQFLEADVLITSP
ncbi:MAG TPA: hypothetical protein VLE22_23520 [Bryobacteraceae bacterium]|nr:hypothetical protein [Bryobacteraceae bacterium]